MPYLRKLSSPLVGGLARRTPTGSGARVGLPAAQSVDVLLVAVLGVAHQWYQAGGDYAVAARHSVDAARWQKAFEGLMDRITRRFARVEPRRRIHHLVLGRELPPAGQFLVLDAALAVAA